ncbi:MAG: hypothetical protein HKN92_11915 [Chitinophagales bacterium]|nr:hypothetical protein [Chitinophagales bacterium]
MSYIRIITLLFSFLTVTDSSSAELKMIYKGVDTILANGGLNIHKIQLPAKIDTAKTFLMFESSSSGDRPTNGHVRGKIKSDSTIAFYRLSNESAPGIPIIISWNVIEFEHGVRTQRGGVAMANRKNIVNINPVVSTSQAFILISKTAKVDDGSFGFNDYILADFNSTSQIEIRVDLETVEHIINWEVIEFLNPADINVQRGSTSMDGTTTLVSSTLVSAVDLSKSFLLTGYTVQANHTQIGAYSLRSEITNNNTVSFERLATSSPDSIDEIGYQVVELLDGSIVHSGKTDFNTGVLSQNVNFPRTIQSHTIAIGSSQPANGQCIGSTSYTANDINGICSYLIDVTGDDQITLERKSSVGFSSINWFVIQFNCESPNQPSAVFRK